MKLYHGSNIAIDSINLAMCRPYKDFGKGFYLTDIEEQARKMAARVSKLYGGIPVVNIFEIQDDFRKNRYENEKTSINTVSISKIAKRK